MKDSWESIVGNSVRVTWLSEASSSVPTVYDVWKRVIRIYGHEKFLRAPLGFIGHCFKVDLLFSESYLQGGFALQPVQ